MAGSHSEPGCRQGRMSSSLSRPSLRVRGNDAGLGEYGGAAGSADTRHRRAPRVGPGPTASSDTTGCMSCRVAPCIAHI